MVRTWMEQRGPSALGRSGFLQSGKDLGQRRYARRLSGPRGCVTGFSHFNWLILSRFVAVGEVEVRETHSPHCFFSTAQLRRCPIKPHNSHQFNLSPTTSRPRPLCHLRTAILRLKESLSSLFLEIVVRLTHEYYASRVVQQHHGHLRIAIKA